MIKTELVRITDQRLSSVANGCEIWTTVEGHNPGGSIKDRMVELELQRAVDDGELKAGAHVAEVSAGSTAVSLAHFARELGFRCSLFVPLTIAADIRGRLQALGAELHLKDPATAYQDYDAFCSIHGPWRLDQMKRKTLHQSYVTWAREALRPVLPVLDLVIGAVGTGHSLRGVGDALRPRRGLFSAEPAEIGAVSGVRNLSLQSFGADDPCREHSFQRTVLETNQFFLDSCVQTDLGLMTVTDSFRLVLGAIDEINNFQKNARIFAIGASNRL